LVSPSAKLEDVHAAMVRRIMQAVETGERDPTRLRALALSEIRGVPKSEGASARARRTLASGKGLVFSLEGFLQDQLVERKLRHRLLQAVVLAFKIFEALGLIELQTAVGSPPTIVALLRDADAPAKPYR